MKKLLTLAITCLLLAGTNFVQSQTRHNPWALTGMIGITEYSGDMGNGFFKFDLKPTSFYDLDGNLRQKNEPGVAGASLTRYISPKLNVSLSYLHGEWGFHTQDNSSYFFKRMNSVDVHFQWKFLGLYDDPIINPFIIAGIGYRNIHMKDSLTSGLQNEITLPLGLGLNFRLTKGMYITAQSYFAFTSADAGDGRSIDFNDKIWNHTIGLSIIPNNLKLGLFTHAKRYRCPHIR